MPGVDTSVDELRLGHGGQRLGRTCFVRYAVSGAVLILF
jgi:hypothetical protein